MPIALLWVVAIASLIILQVFILQPSIWITSFFSSPWLLGIILLILLSWFLGD